MVLLVFVGCGNQGTDTEKVELNISAAASLTDVCNELKELYIKENPNVSITYNFASSGTLQKQIEEGAPADVFISANEEKMDIMEEKDLILTETRQDLLTNTLVLVVGKDSNIKDFTDLTKPEVEKVSIGEPASVPAGDYGKEVLTSLDIWEQIEPKLLLAKSVRQVMAYVDSGDVDAGLVYKTDAMIAENAEIVAEAPENTHKPIVYPMAVVKESKNTEEAQKFADFLTSKEASKIFTKYGFTPVN